MDNFEKKPKIITGLGSIEEAELERKLPAVEVKNEVVWINDDVEMPFKFEENKPSKIGVFLTTPNELEPDFHVKVMDNHFRSALLGKVVFKDKEGSTYRDVDIKGMGAVSSEAGELETGIIEKGSAKKYKRGKTPWGILDWGYAETDRDTSDFFIKQGLRTHRALAIIRLDEIIVENGEKISVSKARKLGYIKYTTEPVIEVRAFGTKARITDVNNQVLLEDAKRMVAQELGKNPDDFSNEDYAKWFVQTLGKQVAIIHNAGFVHKYLTDHNVTLDCRIVDLDSVEKIKTDKGLSDEKIKIDLFDAISDIRRLFRREYNIDRKSVSDFIDSYLSNSHLAAGVATEDINELKNSLLGYFSIIQ